MAQKKRFWASHAISTKHFAVSSGRLDDEVPFSSVLIYKGGAATEWGYVDVPRTIVSITSAPLGKDGDSIFVAMSNEGNVYFLDGDVPVEKIAGAGVLSDDAIGLGSMEKIAMFGGILYACGRGSQVYRRESAGQWVRLGEAALKDSPIVDFRSMALLANSSLALCGATREIYRVPTPDEITELDRLKKEGPNSRFLNYRQEVMKREKGIQGVLAILEEDQSLTYLELPYKFRLNDLMSKNGSDIYAVGNRGVMYAVNRSLEVEDMSSQGISQELKVVQVSRDRTYVLGDDSIFMFGEDATFVGSTLLPNELRQPLSMDVIADAVVYFDYDGIAVYESNVWRVVRVPPELRARGQ